MTRTSPVPPNFDRQTATFDEVLAYFEPVFAAIGKGALDREHEHLLPFEQYGWLRDAGFGALRLPRRVGGFGLTIPQLAVVLTRLATADPGLPQAFRGHIAFVEDRLQAEDSVDRDVWLARFAEGQTVGNAWSEVGETALGTSATTLSTDESGQLIVAGRKFYSTGSIFADWADVTATGPGDAAVTVLVPTDHAGVSISDDWDGFGQQLTGTGSIVFDAVPVEERNVFAFADRFSYQTALYQLVLLSVLAGIAAGVEADAVSQLHARTRVYSHGLAPLARNDGQILAEVGEISAAAFAAASVVRSVAEEIEKAALAEGERGTPEHAKINVRAEIAADQAQVLLTELVPRAATQIFNTLGASATSRAKGLDRHWRNARTVASHNPVIYKARIIGDWVVNGAIPPYAWSIGVAPRTAE